MDPFETPDGQTIEQLEPTNIELEVEPSIAITRLEPVVDGGLVGCGIPSLRVLEGERYAMSVEVIGMDPVALHYVVFDGEEWSSFVHNPDGRKDTLGLQDEEQFTFAPLSGASQTRQRRNRDSGHGRSW